jgi:phosphotransferase system HPr (HPr) family protein
MMNYPKFLETTPNGTIGLNAGSKEGFEEFFAQARRELPGAGITYCRTLGVPIPSADGNVSWQGSVLYQCEFGAQDPEVMLALSAISRVHHRPWLILTMEPDKGLVDPKVVERRLLNTKSPLERRLDNFIVKRLDAPLFQVKRMDALIRILTDDGQVSRREFRTRNAYGVHARPAAQIVKTIARFDVDGIISSKGLQVPCKDLMGILTLQLHGDGDAFTVEVRGPDRHAALDAVEKLVADKFGEA